MSITESTLVSLALRNPHKVFIYNLDIDFNLILQLDFLEITNSNRLEIQTTAYQLQK